MGGVREDVRSQILRLNADGVSIAATRLSRTMAASGGGRLMIVSSLTSHSPIPGQAVYAASKAFVSSFTLGLASECRPHGVHVSLFEPGGIATEMLDVAGLSEKFSSKDFGIMPVERCARIGLRAFARGKPICIPGRTNRVLAAIMKFAPRRFSAWVSAQIYKHPRTRWSGRDPD